MHKLLTKTSIVLLFVLAICYTGLSQTNPTPYDLTSGVYQFDNWSSTSPASTYPTSMIFHTTQTLDANLNAVFDKDWTAAYNLTSNARFIGLNNNGIGFLNTGSMVSGQGYVGQAILAINTINRTQVKVNWVGGFVNIAGTSTRQYALRMQYRVGTTGNWNDVYDGNGNLAEYMNTNYITMGVSTPAEAKNFSVVLPGECDNQTNVQIRWIYYQIPGGSGNRPQYRLDDVVVSTESSFGTPTKLAVDSYYPENPMQNIPFSITLKSVDDNGISKYVNSNTTIKASVYYGTGVLLGTTTKTMLAGTNRITFDDLKYNKVEPLEIKFEVVSGDALEHTKKSYIIQPAPTIAKFVDLYNKGHVGVIHHKFFVQAQNPDGTPNQYYTNYTVNLNLISGPAALTGTTSKKTINGVATFDDIVFPVAGTYVLGATVPGLTLQQNITVTVLNQPTFSTLIIPQFIKGNGSFLPTGNGRTPSFALVKFDGLHPNTEYTFVTAGVLPTEVGNVTILGAGNNIYYDYKTNTYSYTSEATNIADPANRSVVKTAPGQTSLTFWVNIVPTTNSRFTNLNNLIHWLVLLGNEYGDVISRNVSTTSSKQVEYGTNATQASGFYDTDSRLAPKTYLVFYDNANNPVTTTLVQDEGATLITPGFPHQAPYFYEMLENQNGAWATFLPNTLPSGVRKIEHRTMDGTVAFTWTDPDGTWNGVSTVNPNRGSAGLYFGTPYVKFLNLTNNSNICNEGVFTFLWDANGVYSVTIQASIDGGDTWTTIASGVDATLGKLDWKVQRATWANKPLQFRIYSDEHPYVVNLAQNVTIFDTPIIEHHSKGEVYCINSEVTLETVATGTNLIYQWYRDGELLPGENNPFLYFNKIDYKNTGIYYCIVSSPLASCQSVKTDDIVVYVARPTAIGKQPQTMFANTGGSAYFEVDPAANGIPVAYTYTYQWYADGVAMTDNARIQGTKSRMLIFNVVQSTDIGKNYTCTITALCGSATTEPVKLSQFDVSFSQQPTDKRVCNGEEIKITTALTNQNNVKVKYQWMKGTYRLINNDKVSGADSPELIIKNASKDDNGAYQLIVEIVDKGYSVKSKTVTVFVVNKPTIVKQPTSVDVAEGRELLIPIDLGSTAKPYTIEWFKDGNKIDGATETTYKVAVATAADAGTYSIKVTNECGTATSEDIVVKVKAPGITNVEEVVTGEPTLFAPVPNPANSLSLVQFSVPVETIANITLSDVYGNQIAVLANGNITTGIHNITINTNELKLASGIYFVNMTTKFGTISQKLVVIQ